MRFGAHQVICRCLTVPNQTKSTRSAPSLETSRKNRGTLDVPGTGFADFYPWPCEIVS